MQSASSSASASTISIPFWKCNACDVHWQASSGGCAVCGKTGFRLSLRTFEITNVIYAVSRIKDLASDEKAFEEFDDALDMDISWISRVCRPQIQAAWFAIGGDNPQTHPKIALALKALERFYEYAPGTPECMYSDRDAYRYTPEEHASNDRRKNAVLTRTVLEMVTRCETLGYV
jgi:hypothetical protein